MSHSRTDNDESLGAGNRTRQYSGLDTNPWPSGSHREPVTRLPPDTDEVT